jgi:uncharacterized membrane protein YhiD involved in acid resistance
MWASAGHVFGINRQMWVRRGGPGTGVVGLATTILCVVDVLVHHELALADEDPPRRANHDK